MDYNFSTILISWIIVFLIPCSIVWYIGYRCLKKSRISGTPYAPPVTQPQFPLPPPMSQVEHVGIKKCFRCGEEIGEDAKFCHRCGTEVRAGIVSQEFKIEERGELEEIPYRVEKPPFDLSANIELEECKRYGEGYYIVCPSCFENKVIQSSAFSTNLAERSRMGIIATDERIPVASGILSLVSWIIPGIIAILLGSYIGSVIIGIPFLWAIITGILYLLFKPFTDKLLHAFTRKIPVWLVQCIKCGERIVLASDGSEAFIVRKK